MSHHSNGALLASLKKTHAVEVTPQNYNITTMCWDGVLPHSPKSLSRRAFDHPQPIGRAGLLTCLLHFSLQVKSIMVSVVSQMLRQDLNAFRGFNISDPHHLAATFYPRGLLNTSFSSYPNNTPHPETLEDFQITSISYHPHQYSISRKRGGLSKHLHFSYHPHQYSIPRGLPAIVSIINLSSCLCVASGETLMGITAYVATGSVIPTQ